MTTQRYYVHMPKTGGSSVTNARIKAGLAQSQGHTPAHRYPDDAQRWGTLRPPEDWYRSWYAHCRRAIQPHRGRVGSKRAWKALEAYGRGSIEWPAVLEGMLHPADLAHRGALPYPGDPLFAPSGQRVLSGGGMYATHVTHWYRGGFEGGVYGWRVDWLVDTRHLREQCGRMGLVVKHLNAGGEHLPSWPAGVTVPIEDRWLWQSAQHLMRYGGV